MIKLFNKTEYTAVRKKLRHSMTKSEVVLWKRLKESQLGYKFRRQHGIGKYIVDFYCPAVKLVIEIDGITHDDASVGIRDMDREVYLKSLGLHVVRFSSGDVLWKMDDVVEAIWAECKKLDNAG